MSLSKYQRIPAVEMQPGEPLYQPPKPMMSMLVKLVPISMNMGTSRNILYLNMSHPQKSSQQILGGWIPEL
jgi:hypothetical protein